MNKNYSIFETYPNFIAIPKRYKINRDLINNNKILIKNIFISCFGKYNTKFPEWLPFPGDPRFDPYYDNFKLIILYKKNTKKILMEILNYSHNSKIKFYKLKQGQ